MDDDKLISKLKIKSKIRKKGMRVSHGFYESINDEVERIIDRAASRAKANRRTTLLKWDA
jgi:hypothetical protein